MKVTKITYILGIIVLFAFQVNAQSPIVTRSTVIEIVNNQKYYLHTVQAKETVYGICRAYSVNFQDIISINPGIENGISIGQIIKIPQIISNHSIVENKSPIAKSTEVQVINNQEYFVHTVQAGQTLYSIAKLYDITAAKIIETNPENSSNLAIGTKLFILKNTEQVVVNQKVIENTKSTQEIVTPVKSEVKTTVEEIKSEISEQKNDNKTITTSVFKNKKSIRIALLLPFSLDLNSTLTNDVEIVNKKIEIHNSTYPFLEYYEGVLLAIDSLRKTGIAVSLEVYDTRNDSAIVKESLLKIKPEKLDLIIGPVYPEVFSLAADYAKKYKIPIVSPLSSDEIPIKNNQYIIQINSPQKYRFQEIAKFASQYKKCNVIFVYNSIDLEQSQVNECKSILTSMYSDSITKNEIQIKEVYFPKLGISGLEKSMNVNTKNIIIVFSRNQAFINNLVTKLYQFSKKYDIHLLGLPMWEKYENLELDFLFDLQFQFVTNGYIDYTSTPVINFVSQYRELYKTEPTKFSFQGYDQMLYLGQSIIATNQDLISYIVKNPKVGLHDSYVFKIETNSIGAINTSVNMIYYTKAFERKNMLHAKIIESVKVE